MGKDPCQLGHLLQWGHHHLSHPLNETTPPSETLNPHPMRTSLPAGSPHQERASSLPSGCLPSRDLASKAPLPPPLTDAHLQPKQWDLCGERSRPHRRRHRSVIWAQARLSLREGINEVFHSQTPFEFHLRGDRAVLTWGPREGPSATAVWPQLATFILQLCVESFSEWGLEVPAAAKCSPMTGTMVSG